MTEHLGFDAEVIEAEIELDLREERTVLVQCFLEELVKDLLTIEC